MYRGKVPNYWGGKCHPCPPPHRLPPCHVPKWSCDLFWLNLSPKICISHFCLWYVHVKKIFDNRKKAWKKLALHRGSTGFRSQIWQQTHMHGAVLVEPNYIELHKLWYWVTRNLITQKSELHSHFSLLQRPSQWRPHLYYRYVGRRFASLISIANDG